VFGGGVARCGTAQDAVRVPQPRDREGAPHHDGDESGGTAVPVSAVRG